jgi:polysaccharide pyruvyl transferase WcaK-like protein
MKNNDDIYNILLWKNKIWESRVSNTGDLAIILNTIIKVKKLIPGVRLHMFSDSPEYVRMRYSVQAHPIREIFNPIKLYRLIKGMNLVILGGGTILQDNYFIGIIPINVSIGLIAKCLGKKVACNAIGVGSEKEISFFGKRLSIFALKRFDSITVRDPESKELLDRWLNKSISVTLTHDIAVDIPEVQPERIKRTLDEEGIDLDERPTIAIAARKIFHHEKTFFYFLPSSLRVKLGLMHPLFKKRHTEFRLCLAEFCDYIIERYGVNVIFIPFYSSGGSFDSENTETPRRLFTSGDNIFAKEILENIHHKKRAKVLKKNYGPEEVVKIISKCRALIGVPYHSIVFASSRNIPVIGIGYVSKVRRYMKILGMDEYLIPAKIKDGVSLDLLKQSFDKLWMNREHIAEIFRIKNKDLYELSDLNITILEGLLHRE